MGITNLLVWNVRGLNTIAHQNALRELVSGEHLSLVCIQEMKLANLNDFDIIQILEAGFEYIILLADETCDGILVAWRASVWVVSSSSLGLFSVSIHVHHASGGASWWLTSIYGPTLHAEKLKFLAELQGMHQSRSGPWMINGDFNMIY
jgi:exonuclease III